MVVKVEVLYAPTCANGLMHLETIEKVLSEFGGEVAIEEIDVTEQPEALKKYPSKVWQEFLDGYIHYLTLVVINGKILDNWYWDKRKIAEAVRRELKLKSG